MKDYFSLLIYILYIPVNFQQIFGIIPRNFPFPSKIRRRSYSLWLPDILQRAGSR